MERTINTYLINIPAHDLIKGDKVYLDRVWYVIKEIKESGDNMDWKITFEDTEMEYVVYYGDEIKTLIKESSI